MSDILLLCAGLALLVAGSDMLVAGASALASRLGVSRLLIGLTIVAFGTSTPELLVSCNASFQGQSGLAIANVVGSNIFNILFILGVSALIAPLTVASQLVKLDVPVVIGSSLLMFALIRDGILSATDSLILLSMMIVYTGVLIYLGRKKSDEADDQEQVTSSITMMVFKSGLGLAFLGTGAQWMVTGAVSLAKSFGVSEVVIGLTIVAAGTSLPEVAASVMASIRGERDIAVGNVVGSNIFNILAVLGCSGMFSSGGLTIDAGLKTLDVPVMLAATFLCLPIFVSGLVISRKEGVVFLLGYLVYTWVLISKVT